MCIYTCYRIEGCVKLLRNSFCTDGDNGTSSLPNMVLGNEAKSYAE
ncbi:hypothetical protein Goarm_008619 [Gossypium armourianum]|uniref:Uncharacterized protein n=1 Tax=Gossypium armourianum TaxID=34283 RepID=A0A7J9JQI4_9ROSI|nr:hypothetical protein [Gossypium armourianum]MBA0836398.1 hypothetical protein [Gossypium armourianum]